MAGKAKRKGGNRSPPSRPSSARASSEGPQGHLGVKSSPYAVTDSKLISQYMVQDHMTAHYKKLVNAKSCVDATPPKAWMASQKVRDRMRRQQVASEYCRRDNWLKENNRGYQDLDYDTDPTDMDDMMNHMVAIMDNEDELDGMPRKSGGNLHEVHFSENTTTFDGPGSKDMELIDKIVNDTTQSPSQYHSSTVVKSNIPSTVSRTRPTSARRSQVLKRPEDIEYLNQTYGVSAMPQPKTARHKSADLLEQSSHKFTHNKPFQPRILRTKNSTHSKLTASKNYNPPKRKPTTGENGPMELTKESLAQNQKFMKMKYNQTDGPRMSQRTAGSMRSRAMTGMTEGSVDWMNETLMSRDQRQGQSPHGVPPLDISLDRDNLVWLQEQSRQAEIRTAAMNTGSRKLSARSKGRNSTEPIKPTQASKLKSTAPVQASTNGYNKHQKTSMNFLNQSLTSSRVNEEEEELKYLEFVTEVTDDVLDRGIYTNRVLKQVFNRHIERRKGELKVHLMREKLEELRMELQIAHSDDSDDEFVGMTTMRPGSPDDRSTVYSNADRINVEEDFNKSMQITDSSTHEKNRRKNRTDPMMLTSQKINFPTLKQQQTGRPPLPKGRNHNRTTSGSSILSNDLERQSSGNDLLRESIEEENGVNELDNNKWNNVKDAAEEEIPEAYKHHSSNSSLLSTAQEGLDIAEEQEEIVETPHPISSRFSSSITVTPRGDTTDSAGGMASATPIHESDDDDDDDGDESLLDEPQSVAIGSATLQQKLSEYVASHGGSDTESGRGSELGSKGDMGSKPSSHLESKPASVNDEELNNTEVAMEYEEDVDPLDLYRQTLQNEQDDDDDDDTVVGDDDSAIAGDTLGSPEPSAPPTPAKRTSRSLTQVSSMEVSQMGASSDADEDTSLASVPRPTPRKRSSISGLPQITPRTDTKATDDSESLGVSELSDGEDAF